MASGRGLGKEGPTRTMCFDYSNIMAAADGCIFAEYFPLSNIEKSRWLVGGLIRGACHVELWQ